MSYLNADQEVSAEFRPQSSRMRSTRVLSGLNSTDIDWSAFNYYRSKLHSQPNQPHYSILLKNFASLATVWLQLGSTLSKRCICCTLAKTTQAAEDTIFKEPAHPEVTKESGAFSHFAGWQIAKPKNRVPY